MDDDKRNEKRFINVSAEYKSIDEDAMVIRDVVGSSGAMDRHGDRVNPDGWDLANFKKNPVIFVNHDSRGLPIGKAINVRMKNGQLLFDIQFSKTLPKAQEVWGLVKEKIMQAWSVGFIVLEWGKAGGDYSIEKQELLELSIVGIPANPEAMSPKQAKSLDGLIEYIAEHGEAVAATKELSADDIDAAVAEGDAPETDDEEDTIEESAPAATTKENNPVLPVVEANGDENQKGVDMVKVNALISKLDQRVTELETTVNSLIVKNVEADDQPDTLQNLLDATKHG